MPLHLRKETTYERYDKGLQNARKRVNGSE